MEILKAYKYKLKTNKETKDLLNVQANNARFLWNYFLAMNKRRSEQNRYILYHRKKRYDLKKRSNPSFLYKFEMQYHFKEFLNQSDEYSFLGIHIHK